MPRIPGHGTGREPLRFLPRPPPKSTHRSVGQISVRATIHSTERDQPIARYSASRSSQRSGTRSPAQPRSFLIPVGMHRKETVGKRVVAATATMRPCFSGVQRPGAKSGFGDRPRG